MANSRHGGNFVSFSDAKLTEDGVEQVFRRRFAAPAVQALSRIKRSSVEKRRRAAALQDAGAKFNRRWNSRSVWTAVTLAPLLSARGIFAIRLKSSSSSFSSLVLEFGRRRGNEACPENRNKNRGLRGLLG